MLPEVCYFNIHAETQQTFTSYTKNPRYVYCLEYFSVYPFHAVIMHGEYTNVQRCVKATIRCILRLNLNPRKQTEQSNKNIYGEKPAKGSKS